MQITNVWFYIQSTLTTCNTYNISLNIGKDAPQTSWISCIQHLKLFHFISALHWQQHYGTWRLRYHSWKRTSRMVCWRCCPWFWWADHCATRGHPNRHTNNYHSLVQTQLFTLKWNSKLFWSTYYSKGWNFSLCGWNFRGWAKILKFQLLEIYFLNINVLILQKNKY